MKPMKRRSFLKLGAAGTGLALFGPRVMANSALQATAATGFPDKKFLVVFLRGGNDGTNTAPPIGDATYYNQRGGIAIQPADALSLGGALVCGLHPALASLIPIYGNGDLAVVHRIGYTHSSRSHFDAQHYWETAEVDQFLSEGFLGRYLDQVATTANPLPGGAFYNESQLMITSASRSYPQVNDLLRYSFGNDDIRTALGDAYALDYPSVPQMDGVALLDSMDLIVNNLGTYPDNMIGTYPDNALGQHFRDAAWAFRETDCGVAVISDGGYDTHGDQGGKNGRQAILLSRLSACLAAFHDELSILPALWNNTVVMVVSEFGRTDLNASGGTDHGKAGLSLIMGGGVQGGAFNCDNASWFDGGPSPLESDGALDHRVDFRTVLAEIFSDHLGLASATLDQVIPNWSTISGSPDIDHPFEFTPLGLF